MELKYSEQAKVLMVNLQEFKKGDFEKWYLEQKIYINYQDYINFLQVRKQLGVLPFAQELLGVKVNEGLQYSPQLINIFKNIKVDDVLFKKYVAHIFEVKHLVGDGAILDFLDKEEIEKTKEKQAKLNEITEYFLENFEKLKLFLK